MCDTRAAIPQFGCRPEFPPLRSTSTTRATHRAVPGKENQSERLDLLDQLVNQQEAKLDRLQKALGEMLRVLEAISKSVGRIVGPETVNSDDSSGDEGELGDRTQTLMLHKAKEIGKEQDEGYDNDQQAHRKEKKKRKRRSKEKGKGKGKEKEKSGEEEVMTTIVAGDGTIGTEGLAEGSGTTTDRDANGDEGMAAWWQDTKPRWVEQLAVVGKHDITKWIAVTSKDWFLSWSANCLAARYSAYLDRNATTDAVTAAIIAAATALGIGRGGDLSACILSTAPTHCSPATTAYYNTGLMTSAAVRACVVRSPA